MNLHCPVELNIDKHSCNRVKYRLKTCAVRYAGEAGRGAVEAGQGGRKWAGREPRNVHTKRLKNNTEEARLGPSQSTPHNRIRSRIGLKIQERT
jgi:hypothetical protein